MLSGQPNGGALGIGKQILTETGEKASRQPCQTSVAVCCWQGAVLQLPGRAVICTLSHHTDNSPLAGLIGCWQ